MTAQRGFVLVNALVLVGALAAAAMVLLIRAEMSVQRQVAWQDAAQVEAYLDAVEVLAIALLEADPVGGPDHEGEAWARPVQVADLDRGEVSGRVEDLQGRFNINWLAVPEDLAASQAFDRLLLGRGVPQTLGTRIRGFLSQGGPVDTAAYLGAQPASQPRGGPVRDPRQLLAIPGLSPEIFARLKPVIAALPSDTLLNVNTAPAEVLAAWLAEVDSAVALQLVARRTRTPFTSVEDFVLNLPTGAAAAVDETRLTIGSDWFQIRATARLNARQQARRAIVARHPLPVGVLVDYRLPDA